jgi:ATP-dependent protease Clp ATPase subunit
MSKIIGQERIVKELSRIFDIFKVSEGQIRPHFILTGDSGSGKSYIIEQLSKQKELGFISINAAQLTKEGTAGNSLSKALAPIAELKGVMTVVFVDEFDKLFISDNSNSSLANEVTLGVQNEFLKVLESPTTAVYGNYGHYVNIDISKCLFVFAGAFNNEENMSLDKLRTFGVKTEFLGRVGLVYSTDKLLLSDLYEILEESELLKHYLKLFDNVDRDEVLDTIKKYLKANYKNNTIGARVINTLINQYFIKGGELGFEDVKEITFQEKLSLK